MEKLRKQILNFFILIKLIIKLKKIGPIFIYISIYINMIIKIIKNLNAKLILNFKFMIKKNIISKYIFLTMIIFFMKMIIYYI